MTFIVISEPIMLLRRLFEPLAFNLSSKIEVYEGEQDLNKHPVH